MKRNVPSTVAMMMTMMMSLAVLTFAGSGPVCATERIADEAAKIRTPANINVTDFHLSVFTTEGHAIADPSASMKWNTGLQKGTVGGEGLKNGNGEANCITFTWTDLVIDKDVGVKLLFQGKEDNWNKLYKSEAYWTPKKSPTDVPLMGWGVEANGDVYLYNNLAAAISFSDLRFQEPVSPFPEDEYLSDLLDNLPPYGLMGIVDSGTLDAGGSLLVGQFPELAPGAFLSASWNTEFVDKGFSELTAVDTFLHEQSPEPGTMTLLSLGGLGLFGYIRRQRKK